MEGARLAVKEVNDACGPDVNGRKYKVVLIIEDNRDKAEVAVAAANRWADKRSC